MLVSLLILIVTIFSTNGYPSNPAEYEQIVIPVHEQQQFVQQTIPVDYFDVGDRESTILLEDTADFTISCLGQNRICIKKSDCVNGYIHLADNVTDYSAYTEQECKVRYEACCTVVVEFQAASPEIEASDTDIAAAAHDDGQAAESHYGTSEVFGESGNTQVTQNEDIAEQIATNTQFIPTHVQLGCAAALLCVEERFCTVDGTISPQPVSLTSRELLYRVPLSPCKNPETGVVGKCCRDPNYVDPWPAGNLPANYSGGFDEKGFPTFLNLSKVKPPKVPVTPVKKPTKPNVKTPTRPPVEEKGIHSDYTNTVTEVLIPPPKTTDEVEHVVQDTNVVEVKTKCGVRHKVIESSEMRESQTVFGEIPWQAMVLHSRDRKILCSGALVSTHDVLTAANCIESMQPNDISIKLGEWKLGYELKHEEPLPFEILNVSYIRMHPEYTRGLAEHDLAILHLEAPATLDYHVNPLCLPQTNAVEAKKSCIATGWGKTILQAHYAGAIMHAVGMSILSTDVCKKQLTSEQISPDVANGIICTTPTEEINNICEADLGGPLACVNEQGQYELAGIYSQDTGCHSSNGVVIFAPSDEKWIKESMFSETYEKDVKISQQANDYRESTLFEDNQYLPPN
ncbi:PREDICTED: uncharacterized protein LOC107189685 [Dufourea novaeangliae]|uniref:uncharacterized protein LOC107189685 n=1 Tax=Dufourea novaeangliae TaxID=178035 RepID=UPI000766EDF1|nr:PREDICTED: uncharacterized protein LOC107189685 [Dufourea novaeangliae]